MAFRRPFSVRQSRPRSGALFVPGSEVRVVHAKPWKKTVTMTGLARSHEDGLLVLERSFSAGGRYDSIGALKQHGDWGTIEIPEGGRVLRRAYYRADGTLVGELYNIQTPAQFRPAEVRYVDLEIDVVRHPDGRVQVVDEADLEAAVRVRGITPADAETARAIAYRLADLLRHGGNWRDADAPAVGERQVLDLSRTASTHQTSAPDERDE